jgi:hypothetical protein
MDDDTVYELDPNYGRSKSKYNDDDKYNGDDVIHLDDFHDDNNNNDDNYNDDDDDDDDKGNNPNNNSFITVNNDNDSNDDDNNTNNNNNNDDDRGLRFKAADGTLHYLDAMSYRLMKKVTINAIVKAAEAVAIVKQNDRPDLFLNQIQFLWITVFFFQRIF